MRIALISILGLVLLSCTRLFPEVQDKYPVIYQPQDSIIVLEKRQEFKKESLDRISFLLDKIGRSFIGAPYVGKTLEVGNEESLVVNLREFDCTTFVETCLALTTTNKMGGYNFESYKYILKRIRYRDGYLGDYTSRLHYFSDWITDNQEKGYVKDATKILGGIPFPNKPNFMSTHPGAYKQLAEDSTLIEKIVQTEKEIANRNYYYIPKAEVKNIEPYLEEGMIIGITTDIPGLDIIHTGILVRENNRIHLLHASSDFGKVMITEAPLVDYLAGNKRQTGIMVLRLE